MLKTEKFILLCVYFQIKLYFRCQNTQDVYVLASKSTTALFTLYYTSDHPIPITSVTDNEEIILKNNTGCGSTMEISWMCTFLIITPYTTHAQVHISMLNISGAFADVHAFVGIAIYNVMNNKTSLVGHWCRDGEPHVNKKNLTFTGSENQL